MKYVMLAMALMAGGARAAEPVEGVFFAEAGCVAYRSKNSGSNPGDVRLEPGRSYEALQLNAPGGEWVQVRVPGAARSEARWVSLDCGRLSERMDAVPAVAETEESSENLLVLSWQPAFCETRPGRAECRELNRGGLRGAAGRFSLHGLWPQPRQTAYCAVPDALVGLDEAGDWDTLPPVEVDPQTRRALDVAMPGAASGLDRHEWVKHGTCFGDLGGADGYFDDMLQLLKEVNASGVGRFFAEQTGGYVRSSDIRAAFEDAFGRGAGARVTVDCVEDGRRTLIGELRITLRGVIGPETPLRDLILAADPVPLGCGGGLLDEPGLQ